MSRSLGHAPWRLSNLTCKQCCTAQKHSRGTRVLEADKTSTNFVQALASLSSCCLKLSLSSIKCSLLLITKLNCIHSFINMSSAEARQTCVSKCECLMLMFDVHDLTLYVACVMLSIDAAR